MLDDHKKPTITQSQLARDVLGVSPSCLAKWQQEGRDLPKPVIKGKARTFYRIATVKEWVAKQEGRQ